MPKVCATSDRVKSREQRSVDLRELGAILARSIPGRIATVSIAAGCGGSSRNKAGDCSVPRTGSTYGRASNFRCPTE